MTTAGLTGSGGTGRTVTIIQSGRAKRGSMPSTRQSSSDMFLKISNTRSAVSSIFLSCESSFTCFHSADNSIPVLRILGWNRPHPPRLYREVMGNNGTLRKHRRMTRVLTGLVRSSVAAGSNRLSTVSPPSHMLFVLAIS